ncbi:MULTISPECIES: hypothetical protein [Roseiflexus]|uniref:hypothetical protein n=1 Tax=Roseiflexus TaxID=120961 RepID=UPI00031E9C74|nr:MULTISPECIES: hypothetical protein [Roseiflexus]
MSWQAYEVIFRLRAPLHVGWRRVSNLQMTRHYLTGRNVWGALLAIDHFGDGARHAFKLPAALSVVRGNVVTGLSAADATISEIQPVVDALLRRWAIAWSRWRCLARAPAATPFPTAIGIYC